MAGLLSPANDDSYTKHLRSQRESGAAPAAFLLPSAVRMRFLVLSRNASLYSTSRIVLAARARGHQVSVIDPLDFQIVVSRGRPSLLVGGATVPRFDIVIPRIGASITNYGLAVVRQFDLMGVPVLNG